MALRAFIFYEHFPCCTMWLQFIEWKTFKETTASSRNFGFQDLFKCNVKQPFRATCIIANGGSDGNSDGKFNCKCEQTFSSDGTNDLLFGRWSLVVSLANRKKRQEWVDSWNNRKPSLLSYIPFQISLKLTQLKSSIKK